MQDKKIKILRIIARLNVGGPAMQAVFLNSAFNESPFESKLIYGSIEKDEGDMSYLLEGSGDSAVCVKELGRAVSPLKDLVSFIKIFSMILRERPMIVHTHTAKAGAIGRAAAILAGVPVRVHTLHGHVLEGYFKDKTSAFFKSIESVLARFTDRIIVLSPRLEAEIMNNLGLNDPAKLSLIPLGVDADIFLNADSLKGLFKKELGLPEDTRLVGMVGRLVPIKNPRMFVDAAKVILERSGRRYNVKFVIVGDGGLRGDLAGYARQNGISGDLIFTGWQRDLAKVYADLDIVALCSLNEGTPLSVIEAMLSGKPVVATDAGGVPDVVTHSHTGYIVKKNDIDAFASHILNILADETLAKALGKEAREYARRVFTRERLAGDIRNLYNELLKTKGIKK